jgi:hypothetical protein
MKPIKQIHVKYCWQTYYKSIGTLSQIFKTTSTTVKRLKIIRNMALKTNISTFIYEPK